MYDIWCCSGEGWRINGIHESQCLVDASVVLFFFEDFLNETLVFQIDFKGTHLPPLNVKERDLPASFLLMYTVAHKVGIKYFLRLLMEQL